MEKGLLATLVLAFVMPLMERANEDSALARDDRQIELSAAGRVTVEGTVTGEGKPLAGVAVSDGVDVVVTDSEGRYALPSAKDMGYVFVSTPNGYEAPMNGNSPQFYRRLDPKKRGEVEQVDFQLNKVDNAKHAVLAMADFHLANRNDDLAQFRKVASDINQTADDLRREGYKVYGVSLGDESWDVYWYADRFTIREAYREMQAIDVPLYHNMGNHDGNPRYQGDRAASQTFIDVCGPTYYSFNIGGVHYVVLDNIDYINDGASETKSGRCNYTETVVVEQMEWLRRDLALITDSKTPIVVAMHAPLYKHPRWQGGKEQADYLISNGAEIERLLSRFDNVQMLSGHLHKAHNLQRTENIIDHNTPAICGTWWWTGRLVGNSICQDGSPAGYGVYLWEDAKPSWYYKSAGFDKNYQFRAYDLNTTYIDPARYAPNHQADMKALAHGYDQRRADNKVLINVWNYDPQWKVEVLENGRPLQVTRVEAYDPLHIISYDGIALASGGMSKVHFPTVATGHCFMTQASSPSSTLRIKVTDRFGRVYTQDMERPKAFATTMM